MDTLVYWNNQSVRCRRWAGCYVKYLNIFNILVSNIPDAATHRNKQNRKYETWTRDILKLYLYYSTECLWPYIQNLQTYIFRMRRRQAFVWVAAANENADTAATYVSIILVLNKSSLDYTNLLTRLYHHTTLNITIYIVCT